MKNATNLLCLALIACLSLPAAAQDVAGSWQAESISGVKPPEGASLTLDFGDEDTATIIYTLGGESQSWQYRYSVTDGQLKLDPAKPFGEPQTITYDIKFDEGKLHLLSPKPKPAEEAEAEDEGDAEEAAASEEGASADEGVEDAAEGEDAEEAEEAAEETEEEDTRVPVWILTKA